MSGIFLIGLGLMHWHRSKPFLARLALWFRSIKAKPEIYIVGGMAVFYFLLTASLSQILFSGQPHVADTHSQYVHGKIIASGHLYLPSHPLSHFFNFQSMINNGRYYSVYAPGHVLMLGLGHAIGFPWLMNPFSASLTVIAIYLLAREIAGKAAGYIASALMLTSPFMTFMSSEYMNNVTCELFLTLFLFCYIRQHKTRKLTYALLAGACVGYAFITRPQTTLPFALPVAFHAVYTLIRNPKACWRATLALAGMFAFFVGCLLYYNVLMNDNPFIQSGTDPLQFIRPFFTWQKIMSHIEHDVQRMRLISIMVHQQLLGWPSSSLIFVLLLYLFRAQKPYCGILIACCLGQLASLIINPFYSAIFGPRYLYETSTSLIVLTAVCLLRLPSIFRCRLHLRSSLLSAQGAVAFVIIVFSIISFPTHKRNLYNLYSNNYFEGSTWLYSKVMNMTQKPALVFFPDYIEFRRLYFTMPPDDSNPVIIAQDLGKENQKLMDYYPNRTVYRLHKGELVKLSP